MSRVPVLSEILESSKARTAYLKNKLRFVILALTDNDANFKLAAYNALKQRAQKRRQEPPRHFLRSKKGHLWRKNNHFSRRIS